MNLWPDDNPRARRMANAALAHSSIE